MGIVDTLVSAEPVIFDVLDMLVPKLKLDGKEELALQAALKIGRLWLADQATEGEIAKILADAERQAQSIADTWGTGSGSGK